jgi:hypothetical protein
LTELAVERKPKCEVGSILTSPATEFQQQSKSEGRNVDKWGENASFAEETSLPLTR